MFPDHRPGSDVDQVLNNSQKFWKWIIAAFLLTQLGRTQPVTTCNYTLPDDRPWTSFGWPTLAKRFCFAGILVSESTKPNNLNWVCSRQCNRKRSEYKIIILCDQRLKYFKKSFVRLSVDLFPGLEKWRISRIRNALLGHFTKSVVGLLQLYEGCL